MFVKRPKKSVPKANVLEPNVTPKTLTKRAKRTSESGFEEELSFNVKPTQTDEPVKFQESPVIQAGDNKTGKSKMNPKPKSFTKGPKWNLKTGFKSRTTGFRNKRKTPSDTSNKSNASHRTLIISNVPRHVNTPKLIQLCEKYGRVENANISLQKNTVNYLVLFKTHFDALKSLQLNGHKFGNKFLRVKLMSQDKQNKKPETGSNKRLRTSNQRDSTKKQNVLFLENVDKDTKVEEAIKLFQQFGQVKNVYLSKTFNTGFGYVEFNSNEAVQKVLEMENIVLDNKTLILFTRKDQDERKAIYVPNIGDNISKEELWKSFESCGPILSVCIFKNDKHSTKLFHSHIWFKSATDAEKALKLKSIILKDKQLEIAPGWIDMKTLCLKNLDPDVKENEIKTLFKSLGAVESVYLLLDHKTNSSRGCGFITFQSVDVARKAEQLKSINMEDRAIEIFHPWLPTKNADKEKCVTLGNVHFDAREEEIWKLFEKWGPVEGVFIFRDRITNLSHGWGRVCFQNKESVEKVLQVKDIKIKQQHLHITPGWFSQKLPRLEPNTLLLKNIGYGVTEKDIRKVFKDCDEIKRVTIMRDYKLRTNKGHGYVQFNSLEALTTALQIKSVMVKDQELLIIPLKQKGKNKNEPEGNNDSEEDMDTDAVEESSTQEESESEEDDENESDDMGEENESDDMSEEDPNEKNPGNKKSLKRKSVEETSVPEKKNKVKNSKANKGNSIFKKKSTCKTLFLK